MSMKRTFQQFNLKVLCLSEDYKLPLEESLSVINVLRKRSHSQLYPANLVFIVAIPRLFTLAEVIYVGFVFLNLTFTFWIW